MSAFSRELVTEGWVVKAKVWGGEHFQYPNYGPFYNSYRAARKQAGPDGQVFKATVTYEEVTNDAQ